MRRTLTLLCLLCCPALAGCGGEAQTDGAANDGPPEAADELRISVPGVEISASEKEGLNVQAPGVDVKVNEDEGVRVQAPGTDVGVNPDEGVRVETPGVNVRATPGPDN